MPRPSRAWRPAGDIVAPSQAATRWRPAGIPTRVGLAAVPEDKGGRRPPRCNEKEAQALLHTHRPSCDPTTSDEPVLGETRNRGQELATGTSRRHQGPRSSAQARPCATTANRHHEPATCARAPPCRGLLRDRRESPQGTPHEHGLGQRDSIWLGISRWCWSLTVWAASSLADTSCGGS
jgi:hypothetical protein